MVVLNKSLEKTHPLLQESIYYAELGPGLDAYVLPKPGYRKKYALYAVNFGSIDARFRHKSGNIENLPLGIAHFLEHKMFEKEARNVFDEFSDLGASSNAFTTFGHTAYLFSTIDNFNQCLNLLLKFVHSPYFTSESVDKEKGIITQEINMFKDDPDWKVFFDLLQGMYYNHPVKENIAGTVEDINKITAETLYSCHDVFYQPSNMVLFIIGNVDVERVFSEIETTVCGSNLSDASKLQARELPEEPQQVSETNITQYHDISKSRGYLAIKEQLSSTTLIPKLTDEIATDFILELIFGTGSKLHQEMAEKQLLDGQFSYSYTRGPGFGYSMIGGPTVDPEQMIHKMEKGIQRLNTEGIHEEDFNRVRQKFLGEHIQNYNSLEFLANAFINFYFNGDFLFDYSSALYNLSIEDLERRLDEYISSDAMTRYILLPLKGNDSS